MSYEMAVSEILIIAFGIACLCLAIKLNSQFPDDDRKN